MSEPKSWCTVVPLLHLDVGLKTPVYFSKGLWLTLIPEWLRLDGWTDLLNSADREKLKQLKYALITEYEAFSSNAPDDEWDGPEPRSIQDAKHQIALFANFSLWLSRPSPVCYELVFHAPRWTEGWNVQRSEHHAPIRCHAGDTNMLLTDRDLERAGELHSALCSLPGRNSVWTAVHSTWAALQTVTTEARDLLLWTALEALFGREDGEDAPGGMQKRIAFFVSGDRAEAREIGRLAEALRADRLKILHGCWIERSLLGDFDRNAESLVRRALVKVLMDAGLTRQFCSGQLREKYLDDLIRDK